VEILIYEPATNALPSRVVTNSVFTDRRVGGTPEELKLEIKIDQLSQREAAKSLTLSLAEILEYWKLHPGLEGKKAAQVMTQFHGRIAQPFTCLVVVLVALPFGATSGRRNLFAGVAGSVGICFVYFILQRWCLAFGTGDLMHPILAAWLPNFVFAATGLIFLQMRETQSLELGRWLRSFAKPVSSKAS